MLGGDHWKLQQTNKKSTNKQKPLQTNQLKPLFDLCSQNIVSHEKLFSQYCFMVLGFAAL